MKEIPFNPRIFLITAIVNFICAGMSLVCGIVLLSMGGSGGFVPVYVFVTIIFSQIALLAGWQYRAMRALDEKLKNLEESLGRREELSTK